MHIHTSMLSRRIAPIFGAILVFSLLAGCNSGSKNDRGGASTDDAIALNYDGKSIQADMQVSSVNAMFIKKDFYVTIIGGWLAPNNPEKRSGIITTRLTLSGTSETMVAKGSYALEEGDAGDNPSGPMTAMFAIENATLGLPKRLVATSGTFKIDSVDVSESGKSPQRSKLDHIELSYDGTFKNDKDDSDTTEYKLTGTINYTDEK